MVPWNENLRPVFRDIWAKDEYSTRDTRSDKILWTYFTGMQRFGTKNYVPTAWEAARLIDRGMDDQGNEAYGV